MSLAGREEPARGGTERREDCTSIMLGSRDRISLSRSWGHRSLFARARAAVLRLQANRPPSPPSLRQGGQLGSSVALPTESDVRIMSRAASLAGPQRCTGVGSGGAAGCADEVAGLTRRPGRVASGGETEANVAWPPTRRTRNLRSLRERAQAGPERSRSPRGCLQPPLSASRPDPIQTDRPSR